MHPFKETLHNELEALCTFLVKTILSDKAHTQYLQGKISKETLLPFVKSIHALSKGYVEGTPLKKISTLDAEAYALYFTPINYAKIRTFLRKVPLENTPLSVLDVGAGPGTATLACLASGMPLKSLSLVETSEAMTSIGKRVLKSATPHEIAVEWGTTLPQKSFDLIFAANVCNEISDAELQSFTSSLFSKLNSGGALLIVEPALQKTTRRLMMLRDSLINTHEDLSVAFPCTHHKACPMLQASTVDWCHTALHWNAPRLIGYLDDISGFNKHRIKSSVLIVRRSPRNVDPRHYRVISETEKSKRGYSALLCGEENLASVLMKKDAITSKNGAYTELLSFDGITMNNDHSEVTITDRLLKEFV